jgi:hypothetical protein
MKRKIHYIFAVAFALTLSVGVASAAEFSNAPEPTPTVENEMEQIQISVTNGSTVHIKNAEGELLEVYSITGEKVYTQRIDSPSKSYEFSNLPKGFYLVKAGKVTRKVYLK